MRVITKRTACPTRTPAPSRSSSTSRCFGTGGGGVVRRVTEVYEVDRVENGLPVGRTLFRWRREDDSFEKLSEPQNFAQDRDVLKKRREVIAALVDTDRVATTRSRRL